MILEFTWIVGGWVSVYEAGFLIHVVYRYSYFLGCYLFFSLIAWYLYFLLFVCL